MASMSQIAICLAVAIACSTVAGHGGGGGGGHGGYGGGHHGGHGYHQTALDDYVNAPDDNYSWRELEDRAFPAFPCLDGSGTTRIHILNMTSQRWLTDGDVDRSIWFHYMIIAVPNSPNEDADDYAWLYIGGGRNTKGPPELDDSDVLITSELACNTGMVAAGLLQVPNQPIVFLDEDPPRARSEDAQIAYTWDHFYHNPTDTEWLSRMPMTKAAVRGLDTIEEWTEENLGHKRDQFVAVGASKRGWTTWTLAAVDERIAGAIPVVMSLLNFRENIHHYFRSLGGWTYSFFDYWETQFTARIDEPETQAMMDIIDPFVYRNRYTFPILVVSTTGDEFFMPDDTAFWWDKFPRRNKMQHLMKPNCDHGLGNCLLEVVQQASAWALSVVGDNPDPRPRFRWRVNRRNGRIKARTNTEPTSVTLWTANTLAVPGWRDFRNSILDGTAPVFQNVVWTPQSLDIAANGKYRHLEDCPESGWVGFFLEFKFESASSPHPQTYTTGVSILPKAYPFEDCTTPEECWGTLK